MIALVSVGILNSRMILFAERLPSLISHTGIGPELTGKGSWSGSNERNRDVTPDTACTALS